MCIYLSEEHSNICKATCSDLTYKNMRSQIEKVTADLSSTTGCQSDYHVQPQYCIFEGNEGLQDYEYEEYYEPYPVQSAADSGHQLRPETSSHPEGAHTVLYQQQWQGQSHDTYGANRNKHRQHTTYTYKLSHWILLLWKIKGYKLMSTCWGKWSRQETFMNFVGFLLNISWRILSLRKEHLLIISSEFWNIPTNWDINAIQGCLCTVMIMCFFIVYVNV